MKAEIYSCLKMLEALYAKVLNTININGFAAAYNLGKEYLRIRRLLEKILRILEGGGVE